LLLLIFSVCNIRLRYANMKHIANVDVVCASASELVRKEIGKKAILQLGVTIPVYALTEKGTRLVLADLADVGDKLWPLGPASLHINPK